MVKIFFHPYDLVNKVGEADVQNIVIYTIHEHFSSSQRNYEKVTVLLEQVWHGHHGDGGGRAVGPGHQHRQGD